MARRLLNLAIVAFAAWGVLGAPAVLAHKGFASKYTYNEHVFPILRDHCGSCHFEGGPTPMSLMAHADAAPWGESIREQLVSEAMPPWPIDPKGPAIKGSRGLTAKEIDMLITWAVGGTPQGDAARTPPKVTRSADWKAGPPDMTLQMASPRALPAGTVEDIYAFTLPLKLTEEKWLRAVDVLPGTPSMVRSAIIAIDGGAVLAAWLPGDDAIPAPNGTAFRLPAGASLRIQMHYRKHWQDEAVEKSDRSTIGLYFTEPPVSGRGIDSVVIQSPEGEAAGTRTISTSLKNPSRVLALRPTLDQAYASVAIDAILSTGRRIALFRLHAARPQYERRYWLAEPVELPRDTKIEVTAVPAPPSELAAPVRSDGAFQMALDFVPL